MSRNIHDLREWFAVKVLAFQFKCVKDGHEIRIVRTLTTDLTQGALHAIGRRPLTIEESADLRKEGLYPDNLDKVRTNARTAMDTPHGLGLAFDCILLKDGIPWDNPPDEAWQNVYRIAEQCGLDPMGDKKFGEYMSFDKGHFSEMGWKLYKRDGIIDI